MSRLRAGLGDGPAHGRPHRPSSGFYSQRRLLLVPLLLVSAVSAAMDEYYRRFFGWLDEFEATIRTPRDPRDPDYSRPGIFAEHNCWKCKNGTKPCVGGNPHACEYPRARND